jgi:hypothetical protein
MCGPYEYSVAWKCQNFLNEDVSRDLYVHYSTVKKINGKRDNPRPVHKVKLMHAPRLLKLFLGVI